MQEARYHNEDIHSIGYSRGPLDAHLSRPSETNSTTTILAAVQESGPALETSDRQWQDIQYVLCDAQEQRIAYLLFQCGLTPNEIVHRCKNEFPDRQEVEHLRYTVLTKLTALFGE